MTGWLAWLRPGDCLILAGGAVLVALTLPNLWQAGLADKAVIRQNGQIFAEADLQHARQLHVPGPLGMTLIAIEPGRARVVSDPGPRQYCVRQGWLSRPGEIAICAPNRVSLQITGRTRLYDSISY